MHKSWTAPAAIGWAEMKFAICNETYKDWSLEDTIEHAAKVGYDGLELAPFTLAEDPSELTEQQAAGIGDRIRSAGMEVTGLHWLLLAPQGLHLTDPDPTVLARTTEFVKHLARLCGAMGGEVLVWGSPAQRSIEDHWNREEATARAVDAVRSISEEAQRCGVTVAMEPLPPSYTNFLSSAAEGREFISAVDHPACRLPLDVNAMSHEDIPIEEVILASGDCLHYFHANDPCLLGPGMGEVDYAPIKRALDAVEYDGWLSVEVFDYDPGPDKIATESLNYLKRMFPQGE